MILPAHEGCTLGLRWYDDGMKVLSGTVVRGKVEVPKDVLAEGDRVAIVAVEPAEPVQLTPEQEAELVAAWRISRVASMSTARSCLPS